MSEWTVQTLKKYFDRRLSDNNVRYEETFQESKEAIIKPDESSPVVPPNNAIICNIPLVTNILIQPLLRRC